jgi:peptide/nickel transport system permease protein
MGAYILRRLAQYIVVIFGIIVITFVISRVVGDPVNLLLPPEATEEQRVAMTKDLGFDRPIYVQLAVYVSKVARLDFGQSFKFGEPAMRVLVKRIPASLYLCFAAVLISVIIAIPVGIISAIKRGTALDRIAMSIALLGQSAPPFWVGIMLILLLAIKWGWLPPSGYGTPKHVILPALSLAFFTVATIARLTRSSILDVLDAEYVRFARLKGIPERMVILRHVLRNAFVSIFNITALQTGQLFGGAVIAEFIFAWPGIGRLSLDAIYARDYPVVQGAVILIGSFFVMINLVVDIVYSVTDPRVGTH